MRRLGLLSIVIVMPTLVIACSKPNPAFEDCDSPALCEDADADAGDGDGDGDDASTAPNTTGEAYPLPTCPETVEIAVEIAQDTFLDATPADFEGCVIDWNYDIDMPLPPGNLPCQSLDFGGVPMHWACGGSSSDRGNLGLCDSTWLGQFAVEDWHDQAPVVTKAHFKVSAKIKNLNQVLVSIHELDMPPTVYGECGEWMAGEGYGQPPEDCVTTYWYAAWPEEWSIAALPLDETTTIAATNTPVSAEHLYHDLMLPVDETLVEGWLSGKIPHPGVLLTSAATIPTQFNMLAQGSESPPQLLVELCTDAP